MAVLTDTTAIDREDQASNIPAGEPITKEKAATGLTGAVPKVKLCERYVGCCRFSQTPK